ncbi:MAG: hypothetical protein AB3X44_00250 [Leptothrix sp. (in: b-proteobacteria)]
MENIIRRNDPPSQSALHRTAFGLLGATTRDKKQRILILEEEQSLLLDPDQCAKARQDLTNPRSRLACELEWLPSLSPKRATDYCNLIDQDLKAYFKQAESEIGLVRANLVAAGLEMLGDDTSVSNWVKQILVLVKTSDDIDPAALMVILNEDRALAECPLIQSKETVENGLSIRIILFRDAIRTALDRIETTQMLRVVFKVVDVATASGEHRAPVLLDELIDAYGLDARAFLEKEADNITKLVEASKAACEQPANLKILLDKLEKVITNWTLVAKPIQMSMKARGLVHDLSSRVGYPIRSLVLELVRGADDIDSAQRVAKMLQAHFAQFPELAELVDNDLKQLDEIARKKSYGNLLAPIRNLCNEAVTAAGNDPTRADSQGQHIISMVPGLLNMAERSGVTPDVIRGVKDEVAYAICSCAIDYGNKTAKWSVCLTMLEGANIFANGPEAMERVQKNLEIVRRNVRIYGDLTQIDSAPSLYTINGCGVTLYGNTDHDPDSGSYMATYYFVLIFIPIFPICRYRVISTDEKNYRFLGKGKLRTFDKWHLAISALTILLMFLQR